jgi:hypothetical protein
MSCGCGMYPYPARPLHREWRAGYVRTGRRLMALMGAVLVVWVLATWWVIAAAVERMS